MSRMRNDLFFIIADPRDRADIPDRQEGTGNGPRYGSGDADAGTAWNSVARIYVEEMPPPQHH